MLRQNGSPWQRLCHCLCWLDWYFLLGISLHLSRWLGRVSAAVMDKTRANLCTECPLAEKQLDMLVRPKRKHRDCESSSHICPHKSQGQEYTEFGQLGSCVPCVLWTPTWLKILWVQTIPLIWWTTFFVFVLCRIKHANIVSLEEIFESKSHLYLVMQLWVFVCESVWFSCSFRASAFFFPPTHCVSHAGNCVL